MDRVERTEPNRGAVPPELLLCGLVGDAVMHCHFPGADGVEHDFTQISTNKIPLSSDLPQRLELTIESFLLPGVEFVFTVMQILNFTLDACVLLIQLGVFALELLAAITHVRLLVALGRGEGRGNLRWERLEAVAAPEGGTRAVGLNVESVIPQSHNENGAPSASEPGNVFPHL